MWHDASSNQLRGTQAGCLQLFCKDMVCQLHLQSSHLSGKTYATITPRDTVETCRSPCSLATSHGCSSRAVAAQPPWNVASDVNNCTLVPGPKHLRNVAQHGPGLYMIS